MAVYKDGCVYRTFVMLSFGVRIIGESHLRGSSVRFAVSGERWRPDENVEVIHPHECDHDSRERYLQGTFAGHATLVDDRGWLKCGIATSKELLSS